MKNPRRPELPPRLYPNVRLVPPKPKPPPSASSAPPEPEVLPIIWREHDSLPG